MSVLSKKDFMELYGIGTDQINAIVHALCEQLRDPDPATEIDRVQTAQKGGNNKKWTALKKELSDWLENDSEWAGLFEKTNIADSRHHWAIITLLKDMRKRTRTDYDAYGFPAP
jgi:hypothetical protein